MDNIKRLKELTGQIQKAAYAYYGLDRPLMTDKEYDDLYDELSALEKETNCVLSGSPTIKVQGFVLDGFTKVKHTKPMLSANKTKDTKEIEKFVTNNRFYGSYKLDGLTVVVRYKNGEFTQGITRGNGIEGEDVTEQCRFIKNLPMSIPYKNNLELRGECVISWDEFKRINKDLDIPFSHPRNLAAGTLRNLDLNIIKDRNLSFVVFECVTDMKEDSKSETLIDVHNMGFEIVPFTKLNSTVDQVCDALQPEFYQYPTDGVIFELDSRKLSESLGATSHHECCRMALKWEDELYETKLNDIEWNTSKTGLINPVAVFEAVDLDGAITTRATLHNISYIENLQLGIGDTIQVYRANMVIPKVHSNLTMSNTWKLPDKCPCCGGDVEMHNENESKTLHCINPDCKAKLLGKLVHFVSKNAINIDGLSEQTLQKFINLGWLNSFRDIYYLSEYKKEMYKLDGFGKKSVDKLIESIEKSRNTTLDRFIYGLCIPLIGRTASKEISKSCANGNVGQFITIMSLEGNQPFIGLDGFGKEMCNSIVHWWIYNKQNFYELIEEFNFRESVNNGNVKQVLEDKIFVITGSLKFYKNRDELVNVIERNGGKVSGSVSAKTSYLINNDVASTSGKNKKAHDLGIPIISEGEFIQMITS
ncbi:NAD-dependent DNA ligase LigA [Thomasclavelia cocleata]|uniref:NAD-dependent DNA ligase LigA n=1 Tax=Thomasclavelia cocleata TaxID=69824 RepID=UPI00255B097C|nr:NAD-dependent DNA ligase LigA [Thomasclavelia cocleata]